MIFNEKKGNKEVYYASKFKYCSSNDTPHSSIPQNGVCPITNDNIKNKMILRNVVEATNNKNSIEL